MEYLFARPQQQRPLNCKQCPSFFNFLLLLIISILNSPATKSERNSKQLSHQQLSDSAMVFVAQRLQELVYKICMTEKKEILHRFCTDKSKIMNNNSDNYSSCKLLEGGAPQKWGFFYLLLYDQKSVPTWTTSVYPPRPGLPKYRTEST
jgi:hypothetical protein